MKPAAASAFLADARAFHEDEDGMETLQVVMIAGISAVILLVLVAFWKDIKGWVTKTFSKTKQELPE